MCQIKNSVQMAKQYSEVGFTAVLSQSLVSLKRIEKTANLENSSVKKKICLSNFSFKRNVLH